MTAASAIIKTSDGTLMSVTALLRQPSTTAKTALIPELSSKAHDVPLSRGSTPNASVCRSLSLPLARLPNTKALRYAIIKLNDAFARQPFLWLIPTTNAPNIVTETASLKHVRL